jgi:UDP-glucose 4-epimerase
MAAISKMNKRRVMLIGGSGFIGSCLSKQLQENGIQPVVVDWVKPSLSGIEYHAADLRTITDLTPSLLQSVEAVYMLAWSTKPQSANLSPSYDLESNVLSGLHFLDGLLPYKKRPRIIFVSSGGAIYGAPQSQPTSETAISKPISAYGISKLTFELYLDLYHRQHGLDYLVLRPGNPYGEGQNPDASQGAIGVFLGCLKRKKPIHIWGDGGVIRDYLYIKDLAQAMLLALDYKPNLDGSRVFNLGSGKGVSLNTLLKTIASVTGIEPCVHYEPARIVDVPCIILDCNHAQTQLGWCADTTLETGLARTWSWINESWGQ